jgi:hypothetical protein
MVGEENHGAVGESARRHQRGESGPLACGDDHQGGIRGQTCRQREREQARDGHDQPQRRHPREYRHQDRGTEAAAHGDRHRQPDDEREGRDRGDARGEHHDPRRRQAPSPVGLDLHEIDEELRVVDVAAAHQRQRAQGQRDIEGPAAGQRRRERGRVGRPGPAREQDLARGLASDENGHVAADAGHSAQRQAHVAASRDDGEGDAARRWRRAHIEGKDLVGGRRGVEVLPLDA